MAANVVVINHYLLFADLAVREFGMAEILPILHPYDRTRAMRSLTPMALVGFGIGLPATA